MRVKTRIGIGVASAAVLAAVGVSVAVAVAVADDQEITGPAADQARTAAVKAIPGKAGEVEKETNEGAAYYGVLVTKPDGTQVEVHLDKGFHFLGTEAPDND
jgi:Peptidase propeptide and YPEB domain